MACSGCATALSGEAITVEGTRAHLVADLMSDADGQIEYWSEYGPTTTYGSSSPHQTVDVDAYQRKTVNVQLTGLSHDTTYHFRICAQDATQQAGPGCSKDHTIHTVNLDCGETVTHDVVLSGNLHCERFDTNGLIVGADGLDIGIGGHNLTGPLEIFHDSSTPVAIDNSSGFDDVTVHNGSIEDFGRVAQLTGASYNVIRNLGGGGNTSGLYLVGGEGNVLRNLTVGAGGRFGAGLDARKTDGLVVVDSTGAQWEIDGNDARVLRNHVGGPTEFSICLGVRGNRNRIADNVLGGCALGDLLLLAGSDNALVDNQVFDAGADQSGAGIRVDRFTAGTLLQGNYAHDNSTNGIAVLAPATRLQGNRANDNGTLGIDAIAGVTDLGGNTASGNGDPLQCRNVFCTAGP